MRSSLSEQANSANAGRNGPSDLPLNTARFSLPGAADAETMHREALRELMHGAPKFEECGIAPELYRGILTEVRQHTAACLERPRITHTNLINDLVQKELAAFQERQGDSGWKLRELKDELRNGTNRLYIFGQVDYGQGPSIFIGRWRMERNGSDAPIYFKITAEPELLALDRSVQPSPQELQDLLERGPAPWKAQVPRGSPVAAWISQVYGCHTTGFIEGQCKLGVFTDAVERACAKEGLTHMLLPRGRRDPGRAPWHVGSFLTFNGERFLWNDWALDRSGAPVRAVISVTPRCSIEDPLAELKKSAEGAP